MSTIEYRKTIPSYNTGEAIEVGIAEIHPTAEISENVRFIPYEDDGESRGMIRIGAGSRIREGCTICSGAQIGDHTVIGHNVVVRRNAQIGDHTVISHMVCIEYDARIGDWVRISPLTHICGGCVLEDEVLIGARVATVHAREMRWVEKAKTGVVRDPIVAPVFRRGCRIGSGSTIMVGVEIGERTLVGSASLVTRSLPPNVVAFGSPAYVQREVSEEELTELESFSE